MNSKYIRYNRITKTFKDSLDQNEIQLFLNDLIIDGFEIISYFEKQTKQVLTITILAGKLRDVL